MTVSVLTNVENSPSAGRFNCTLTADATPVASAIYMGFTPNHVILQQIAGTPDATWRSEWHKGMAAASNTVSSDSSQGTIPTTNGFTLLTGNEPLANGAVTGPVAATGSPASSGQGIIVGTGVVAATIVYNLSAFK